MNEIQNQDERIRGEEAFVRPNGQDEPLLDYAQIINSLAFLTDDQRAGFFALLGASYCLKCGRVQPSDSIKCTCSKYYY